MAQVIGTAALGIYLGYMAWYFAVRVKDNWMTSFASVSSVLFGGVVLAFMGGVTSDDRWWYPIGLVIGFALFAIARRMNKQPWPTIVA